MVFYLNFSGIWPSIRLFVCSIVQRLKSVFSFSESDGGLDEPFFGHVLENHGASGRFQSKGFLNIGSAKDSLKAECRQSFADMGSGFSCKYFLNDRLLLLNVRFFTLNVRFFCQ